MGERWSYQLLVHFEGLPGDLLRAAAGSLAGLLRGRARVDGGGVQGRRSFLSVSTNVPGETWEELLGRLPDPLRRYLQSAAFHALDGRAWVSLWPATSAACRETMA